MTPTAVDTREQALAELRLAMQSLMGASRRLRGREAGQSGLSYPKWLLLRALSEHGEQSAVQLAAAAELAPATVTPMLDQLVAAGIVERTRSESDRRVVANRLTDEGRRLWQQRAEEVSARWEAALADLDEAQLRDGAAVLARLTAFFKSL